MSHAILSASASHRWLNCPPSALLEKKFPDTAGSCAEEGSFAHAYAERKLQRYLGLISASDYASYLKQMKTNPYYCEELDDYVQEYVDLCIEKINSADNPVAMPEERLHFGKWVPGGFGTGDMVIISDNVLEIVDLKYGQGVAVSAKGNTQLQLYALGALDTYSYLCDFDRIKMTICQPRNGGISEQEMTIEELLAWGESIKPIAEQAIKGEGEFKAGDHCRFCKAANRCRALSEYSLEIARREFATPELLSDAEIAEVVLRVPAIENYAKTVKSYALREALLGKKWTGLKIVESRSNRKYTNEDLVSEILVAAGYNEADIYNPKKLLAITNLEKLITKKKFNVLLSDCVVKAEGKPTLVPEADKRPEFSPADHDFEIIANEENV